MVKWLTSRPGRITYGKGTSFTLCWRLGEPQGQSGLVRKIPPPPGFVRQTDNAIPAHADVYGMVNREFIRIYLVVYIIAVKWYTR